MRVLVAGGSGFIGGHLVESLIERGYETIIYDLKEPDSFQFNGDVILGDVTDSDLISKSICNVDVVFDCSGILGSAETFEHIMKTAEANITGTLSVLKACHDFNKPLVYLSLKNKWYNPYMITKRSASEFCLMYSEYLNLPVTVVKGLNAYGPRQHWEPVRKVFPSFVVNSLQDKPITIFGDGNQIVDMIWVKDLVEILILVAEKNIWGESIDAGTGIPITVKELAKLIIITSHSKSLIDYLPMRIGEPEHAVALADPLKCKRLLNYYPKVSLNEGVEIAVGWYRKNYSVFGKLI